MNEKQIVVLMDEDSLEMYGHEVLEYFRNEFPAYDIDIIKRNTLARIYVESGCVEKVEGLPAGIDYKIIDYDEITSGEKTPSCGNCKYAETCKVRFGDEECNYEHIYHKQKIQEKRERDELEVKAKVILLKTRREDIIKQIIEDFPDNKSLQAFIDSHGEKYKFGVFKKE